jgi:hypothetical protein
MIGQHRAHGISQECRVMARHWGYQQQFWIVGPLHALGKLTLEVDEPAEWFSSNDPLKHRNLFACDCCVSDLKVGLVIVLPNAMHEVKRSRYSL